MINWKLSISTFSGRTIWVFSLFSLLAVMAVAKYLTLHSTIADLGFFLNHFYNIASGELWRLFFIHFQPLMFLWSLFYGLFSEQLAPVIILSVQAAFLAWPSAGLIRHFGILPALAFVLYFPVWYNALFDFHMDHLAVPLLFGFFFLEKEGRIGAAVTAAILLAFVKEPYALQTAACGLYILFVRKHRLAGMILIMAGLAIFYAATHYLIPFFSMGISGSLNSSAYSWLGHSFTDKIVFIISNPHVILGEIFSNTGKLGFVFYLLAALGFIPLLQLGILLVSLPVFAISLLSSVPNHVGTTNHYTSGLIAPLIIAFASGLPRAQRLWCRAGLRKTWFTPLLFFVLFFFHIWHAPSPISRVFWSKNTWAYSAKTYSPSGRNDWIKTAILSHIPPDKHIIVSAQNSVNWGYLAHRKYFFPFPLGVLQPFEVREGSDRTMRGWWNFIRTQKMAPTKIEGIWADYVVLDLKRPWFLIDRGCAWRNGKCRDDDEFASRFLSTVQQTKERFDTVFQKDGFYILKRKHLPAALR